ncbi:DASH complex subunit HSK3 family protein [Aspergillus homomorphus CBS 101889]|uniref:DASH complex subunit Hsk3 like-domain-containing protein n=1 Tax=Aspergillus homomorphus (strain CBS 101889) TaxID=1450537 RepID=A0A395HTB1_ASPHC|nr:hypothetical protein BO97DRAFT_110956 [Aspergillus homomorphus CBS 101889]RAL11030.1 hypothetical protein BO97DRAFT_110956 [Aspergillus homomorphus CBS 101889]
MPPTHQYTHSQSCRPSQSQSQNKSRHNHLPRHSILPPSASMGYGGSTTSMSMAKTRQYANLHAQLAQLNSHLRDTENLVRMTAVQAEDMRFLGGYVGALFMGSAKVLGEEGIIKGDEGGSDSASSGGGSGGAAAVAGGGESESE